MSAEVKVVVESGEERMEFDELEKGESSSALRRAGSVSPIPVHKKVPSRKLLLLRMSRAAREEEEAEEDDEEEGAPLDLSCHRRRGSGELLRVKARGDSCSSSSSVEWGREYTEDSDDSDGQPMDLGINPKAYKKSLMKRYCKWTLFLEFSISWHYWHSWVD